MQRFDGKFFSKDFNHFARDVISCTWRKYPKVSPFQTFREVNSRCVVDPNRMSDRQIWDGVIRTSFLPEGHEYNTQIGNLLRLNTSLHLMSGICAESPCSIFSSTKGMVDLARHIYMLIFILRKDIKGNFVIPTLILPFFFTLAFPFFYALVPERLLSRLLITLIYAFGLYSLFLTQNIFAVSGIRTINLLRSARIVAFVLTRLVLS